MKGNRPLFAGLLALLAVVVAVALLRGGGEVSSTVAPQGEEDTRVAAQERPQLEPVRAAEVTAAVEPSPAERTEVPDHLGELRVRVLDKATDLPLPAVPVVLVREKGIPPMEQTSGADGYCHFEALEQGEYTLETQADGDLDYVCEATPATLGEGANEEVVVLVERRWFLAGAVVEKGSGSPVAGVSLMTRDTAGRGSSMATSGDGGRFRSRESYPAGVLIVFLSQSQTEGLMRNVGDGPELLQVTVGQQDVTRLTVEIDWLGIVRGVVLDERGRPIPDARVRVLSGDSIYLRNATLRYWGLYEEMRDQGRTTHCDDEGRFRLERLPNDRTLVVVASAPGFVSARSADLSPPFLASDDPVVVHLLEGGTIVGTVLDARGEPVDGAIVSALSSDTDYQPDPTSADAQGAFLLEGIQPGPTEVTAQARDERRRRHAIASSEVEVLAGQDVRLVLQAGADGVQITGIAVDQDGRLITGDRVRLSVRATPLEPQPGEAAWGHDTPVADDGTFNVTVARKSTYRLALLSHAAGNLWESLEVQAPAQDVRLTFTIRPSCQLTLRPLDAQSGEAIERGSYSLSAGRGSYGGNFAGGRVVTTVQEGLYTVSMSARGYASVSQELDLRGPLQPEVVVELHLERGRPVSGIVVDGSGQPVKGCTVVLFTGSHLDLENLTHSDADGRFTIPSAPAIGAQVWVIDESYRAIATAEIGAGDVVLTVREP